MAEPIPLDPIDSIIWSTRFDLVDEDTLEEPKRNDIDSFGELTNKVKKRFFKYLFLFKA